MVIAPFTGFELFSAAITGLYFYAFPSDIIIKNYPFIIDEIVPVDSEEVRNMKEKFKTMSLDNIQGLRTWSNVWGLGKKWYNLAKFLQEEFETFRINSSNSPTTIQNETIRHTMHDYGNGEVQEVYNPKRHRNIKLVNSLLKNKVPVSPAHNGDIPLNSSDSTPDTDTTNKNVFKDDVMLNYISFPALNFLQSFDSASIFPGWNDNLEI